MTRSLLPAYLTVFALLLLAALNPSLPWGRAPLDLIILWDDSLSMADRAGAEDWTRISNAARQLPGDSRIHLLRFAGDSVLETTTTPDRLPDAAPPQRQALDRTTSDLEAALYHALRLITPGRDALFLLVSDGRETRGEARRALQTAREAGVRVLGLSPATQTREPGLWIRDLAAPARARLGTRIPVTVTLAGTAGGRLRLLVDGSLRGERTLAASTAQQRLWFSPKRAGAHLLELRVEALDGTEDHRQTIVNVEAPLPLLYVSQGSAPLAQSLLAGGLPMQMITPQQFPHDATGLEAVSAVVLDDVAIDAMAETAWLTLAWAVRYQGLGLIVLGGPHAFGGGSYRHSLLEELLPVTAEGRENRPPAAVLFVVDRSGSMARNPGGASRIAIARQAVIHTARALPNGDLSGLLAFDVEATELLPLAAHADPVAALQGAWHITPSGGTRLGPALSLAIDRLAESDAEQRLLILLSDGFVGHENLQPLQQRLADSGIDLIALAIGSEVETAALEPLTTVNRGRLEIIDRLARLPRIMREAVEERRSPAETGGTRVSVQTPPPFLPGVENWPALSAYMVTRARPEATVYLRAEKGDPLLAMRQAGLGRVVALPGGLGPWAASWHSWRHWPRLAGGLVAWVAGNTPDTGLSLTVGEGPGYLDIDIETGGKDDSIMQLVIRDPLSRTTQRQPQAIAPGRYRIRLPVQLAGRYDFGLRVGDRRLRQAFIHGGSAELTSRHAPGDAFQAWRKAGLMVPWAAGSALWEESPTRAGLPTRPGALLLAVLLYFILIAQERGLLNAHPWRLASRKDGGGKPLT